MPGPQIDSTFKSLRAAAILTNSYVGAFIPSTASSKPREYNQLVIYIDFTVGSLTTASIKVEFAPYMGATTQIYQESDETSSVTSNVDTKAVNTVVHQFSLTGKYRLLIPIADEMIKISAIGTGTVTSSSMAIDYGLIKNFA